MQKYKFVYFIMWNRDVCMLYILFRRILYSILYYTVSIDDSFLLIPMLPFRSFIFLVQF
jgi:hypothetical protein